MEKREYGRLFGEEAVRVVRIGEDAERGSDGRPGFGAKHRSLAATEKVLNIIKWKKHN